MAKRDLSLDVQLSNIYSNVEGLNLQQLYYVENHTFPNCYLFSSDAKKSSMFFDVVAMREDLEKNFLDKNDPSVVTYSTINLTNNEIDYALIVVSLKNNIWARFEKSIDECYVLYGGNSTRVDEFLSIVKKYYVDEPIHKNKVFVVASSNGNFMLNEIDLPIVPDFDVNKQYNDDFIPQDTKIKEFIATPDKSGILILHGEPGTGKTTYIKHLVNSNPEKKFVFIPSPLVSLLSEPSFNSFLLGLNNCIFILEDCDTVLKSRNSAYSDSSVSSLLNMSDGILSGGLSIKFICTFNSNLKEIDSALLRKGRLISRYEFKPLCVEKANVLVREVALKQNSEIEDNEIPVYTKPTILAEIFNFNSESYLIKNKTII